MLWFNDNDTEKISKLFRHMFREEEIAMGSERLERSLERQSQGCIHHHTDKRTLRVTHVDSPLARLARQRKWLQRTCLLPH